MMKSSEIFLDIARYSDWFPPPLTTDWSQISCNMAEKVTMQKIPNSHFNHIFLKIFAYAADHATIPVFTQVNHSPTN